MAELLGVWRALFSVLRSTDKKIPRPICQEVRKEKGEVRVGHSLS